MIKDGYLDDTPLHDLYSEIRDRVFDDNINHMKHEEVFERDFYSWDKSDCSELGLSLIYAKYLIGEYREKGYMHTGCAEATELIDRVRDISFY